MPLPQRDPLGREVEGRNEINLFPLFKTGLTNGMSVISTA